MSKLNDLSELKTLAKQMKKEEKKEKNTQIYTVQSKTERHPLQDGSDATLADYLTEGDIFLEDKYEGGHMPVKKTVGRTGGALSKYLVIDLHIGALEHPKDLPKEKYLEWQLKTFRQVMEANESHLGRKIIFIHGEGDGVLRRAITKELDERWWTCSYAPAPEERFGFGAALSVTIK